MSKKTNTSPFAEGKMMSSLPYKTLKDISDRLDLLKDGKTSYWRELATLMDYDHITVEKFGMLASKQNGSPGYSLLCDMCNKGVSYEELVSYLKRLELFDALVQIDYREDVRIIKHPVATPVMNGQKLRLECKAEGVPRPQYLWFKGLTALENQKSPILEIKKVTPADAGIYTCRASNTANFVFSQWVEVQVQNPTNKGPVAPNGPNEDSPVTIEQHPKPAMLEVGQKLFLNCLAYADSKLEYQWFLNGKELIYGTSQDLVIEQVQMSDQGVYVCCVKCSNGASVLTKGAEVVVVPLGQLSMTMPHPPASSNQRYTPNGNPTFMMDTPMMPGYHLPQHQMEPMYNSGGYEDVYPPHAPVYTPTHDIIHSPEEPVGMQSYEPSKSVIMNSLPTNDRQGGTGPHRNLPPLTPGPLTHIAPPIDNEPRGQDDYLIDKPCADKVALLIGNKSYHVTNLRLNTPENDTQDLTGILRSADFKVVSLINLTKREMDDAIDYFVTLLGRNVYAVFFFAGHGFELNQMNYMMAVDCTKQKNPSYSVCAQKVLNMMQETGAKLSIVLLDMCRVVAPQDPITDFSGAYQQPNPSKSYPGYHIYGFSCSTAEKAFELALGAMGGEEEIRSIGEGNSIFVAALKEILQSGRMSIEDTVESLFSATAKSVHRHKPQGVDDQWQRPEMSSNVAVDLSLADTIDTLLLPSDLERRSLKWKDAHSVPEPLVLGSNDGHLALRLHFEAEHTNVLLIQVEVLQGCLFDTEVERMNVELILQEKPVFLILAGTAPQNDYGSCTIPVQKSIAKKNLLYFKVPDLQKITSPEVTLHITTNYRWRDSRKEGSMWQFQMEQIYYRMSPPPLYGKITTFKGEERRQKAPPPSAHFPDPRMYMSHPNPPSLHPLDIQ